MKVNPKKLVGNWKVGFALDLHTLSSKFIGYNEFGHEQFESEYSYVGGLLNRLKYHSDKSVVKVLGNTGAEFVKRNEWPVELIVPVPPSRIARRTVEILAKSVGRVLGIPVCLDCVVKVKETPELKSVTDRDERLKLLSGAYAVSAEDLRGRTVLLLDDLYRSGATLNAVADSLTTKGQTKAIYVLTFTKTRSRR